MPAPALARRVTALDPSRDVRIERDAAAAVELAMRTAGTVCVAGSIFVAGAVRDGLRRRAILR
jgi:hypothetical protein